MKYDISHEILNDNENEFKIKFNTVLIPASRPRVSRFGSYIAEPYKTFKKEFSEYCKLNLLKYGNKFISHSLSIDISYFKSFPKSYSKKKMEELIKCGNIHRPDIDNYYKSVLDSMEDVFYSDDSFIVELCGRKLFTYEKNDFIIISIKKYLNIGESV